MLKRVVVFLGGRHTLFALLLALMLIGTAGCFYVAVMDQWFPQRASTDTAKGEATAISAALPAPSSVARSASSCPTGMDVPAANYEAALGCNLFAVESATVRFSPTWVDPSSSAASDLAYGFYAFDLGGHTGEAALTLSFSQFPEDYANLWVGLADYGNDRWEWLNGPASGALDLPALGGHANGSGQALLAIMLAGQSQAVLDTLRLDLAAPPSGLTNIFFLHHSTGAGLVFEGDMRGAIAAYNTAHSTAYEFWDHGYYSDGLTDPDGELSLTNYGPNTDYTDPPNLHDLWTGADADWLTLRTTILANHEVIAFKSCFPASAIPDTNELNYRKEIYLEMRDFFDTRLDKLFVVISTPPLRDELTNATEAGYARDFAEWLKSSEYLAGHLNVVCFDLFDALAAPDGSGPGENMLRAEYQIEAEPDNGHPNTLANQTVGPLFAQFLCDSAVAYTPPGP